MAVEFFSYVLGPWVFSVLQLNVFFDCGLGSWLFSMGVLQVNVFFDCGRRVLQLRSCSLGVPRGRSSSKCVLSVCSLIVFLVLAVLLN